MKCLSVAVLLAVLPLCLAAQSCPLGASNDPHPGQCGSYRDANIDSLCDLSQAETESPAGSASPKFPDYHLWEILLSVAVLAAATEVVLLRKRGLAFRLQTLWNWLLLAAFAFSALSGIYFALPPSLRPATGLNLVFWHTEAGLAFVAVGLYHAVRRLACMIRGLGACFPRR